MLKPSPVGCSKTCAAFNHGAPNRVRPARWRHSRPDPNRRLSRDVCARSWGEDREQSEASTAKRAPREACSARKPIRESTKSGSSLSASAESTNDPKRSTSNGEANLMSSSGPSSSSSTDNPGNAGARIGVRSGFTGSVSQRGATARLAWCRRLPVRGGDITATVPNPLRIHGGERRVRPDSGDAPRQLPRPESEGRAKPPPAVPDIGPGGLIKCLVVERAGRSGTRSRSQQVPPGRCLTVARVLQSGRG